MLSRRRSLCQIGRSRNEARSAGVDMGSEAMSAGRRGLRGWWAGEGFVRVEMAGEDLEAGRVGW